MKHFGQTSIAVIISLFAYGNAAAQTPSLPQTTSQTTSALVESTEKAKASTKSLLLVQEEELKTATQKLSELRQLVAEGLVARVELEREEQSLAAAETKLEETKQQIIESDRLLAGIQKAEELAKIHTVPQLQKPRSLLTPTILRYNGTAGWMLGRLSDLQAFFVSRFGRSLPTSAIGQSATHNALGYDHRNAVDVALHPDSMEGKALISYLQSKSIPYLAFRAAVPGVATGPHIHIGSPSHRI
jgi:hypothetical protein